MLASHKKARDNSGHPVHPNHCKGLERPDLVFRVFRTRYRTWGQSAATDSVIRRRAPALDCAVPSTRLMSRTGRTVG
jgi:hypothetical protein